jgi:hypothetical protein
MYSPSLSPSHEGSLRVIYLTALSTFKRVQEDPLFAPF